MTIFRFSTCRSQIAVLLSVLLGLLAAAQPAAAQDTTGVVPRNEEAELIFEQGLDAFEDENYGMAYRRFRLIYREFPLNRKTTAALLMAGKALYRDGQYEAAAGLLDVLVDDYPTSSYVDEARRTRDFARGQLEREAEATQVLQLGVALPLRDSDALLVQALFNGIRLAVEEHNQTQGQPVRMIFRSTEGDPQAAREAVAGLVRENADVILGPLYSREAHAAAAAAEEAGVVMMAPMATDEDVSEGRPHVFQANPTITTRGRLMAQFAAQSLLIDDFGVVGQYNNDLSERMAEGFQEEALEQGATVEFFELLQGARAWSELPEAIGADTLGRVEAVYLPVSGDDAARAIQGILGSFDRANVNVRILGNSEWHDRPIEQLGSRFRVTYTNDFYVDETEPAVQDFIRRYRELTGEAPDQLGFTARRLAYTGYDVARYLLTHLARTEEQPLREALRNADPYQGLGVRIDFRGGNVNQAMYYHRYRSGRVELLR